MKERIFGTMLVVFLFLPGMARAQFDFGAGSWLSGQNSLLVELLATQVEQLSNIKAMLENARYVASATNEGLALARQTFREVRAISNFDTKDLMMDAKRGLWKAFPDLAKIEQDSGLIKNQIEGGDAFSASYSNKYDEIMARKFHAVLEHAYKASIWPNVFPDAFLAGKTNNPTETRIWKLYQKSGMVYEMAYKNTAMAALAKKVANFVADAEKSKNLEVATAAANAQINAQTLENSNEFLSIYKSLTAEKMKAKEEDRARSVMFREALVKQARDLFGQDAMEIPER